MLFSCKYISDKGLANLSEYRYHGVDHSIFAKLLQYWWNFAIHFLPRNIAPNLITLTGLCFLVLSFLALLYYSPDMKKESPWYILVFHSFCLFMYQTMDALDGKQARRTGTSSPLGELFDHGCDAVSVSLISIPIMGTLQLGSSWTGFILLLSICILFYCAQWEEYCTGSFVLGYLNVTEAQLLMMLCHLMTAIFGGNFWSDSFLLYDLKISYFWIPLSIIVLGFLVTFFSNIYTVEQSRLKKNQGFLEIYSLLVPAMISSISAVAWVYLSEDQILLTHPILFYLTLGFLFPNLVGRIVVARVCKEKFHWFQPIVLPLAIGALNSYRSNFLFEEYDLVRILFLFYFGCYIHFALCVIDTLCNHLKIKCLSIPSRSNQSIDDRKSS